MKYLTFSSGILKIRNLQVFLDGSVAKANRFLPFPRRFQAIVGWGLKDNTVFPRSYAARHNLQYVTLEEGFIRSIGLGPKDKAPFSLIADDIGIYYDANRPSRLENILNDEGWYTEELAQQAKKGIELIKGHNLTKYNNDIAADTDLLSASERPKVLLIDQTRNDMAVKYGFADASSFKLMLEQALKDNPDADVYVKAHPLVIAGKRRGYLTELADPTRVRFIHSNIPPYTLLPHFQKVYTVTSQMGFEALMAGCQVHCFGMPFYAGWGLTQDWVSCPRRKKVRSVEELFAAAYILYPTYVNQLTGERSDLFEVISTLSYLKTLNQKNSGKIFCFGFATWRHDRIRRFLRSTDNRIHFVKYAEEALAKGIDSQSKIFVWGSREMLGLQELSKSLNVPIGHIEDGFIRSLGLGSDLVTPYSLAVDYNGIYYDPSHPSDLEIILQTTHFDNALLERSRRLREKMVACSINKYNVGHNKALNFQIPPGKRVILVPGQVENDASVLKGGYKVKNNLELLQAVREENPTAFIIYKTHPDVLVGNRPGGYEPEVLLKYCDYVENEASILKLIEVCDEVHTLTSLAGFEALVRGKDVVTYGMPFYAGWGLTEDKATSSRRTRRLTIDELFAGAIILYPRYYNWEINSFDIPENTLNHLVSMIQVHGTTKTIEMSAVSRRLLQASHFIKNLYNSIHMGWVERTAKLANILGVD